MGAKQNKSVLTTGEVAKLCNVAPRTVAKWFDAGHLRGYRIPGSKDRRIPADQLVKFMQANNIPLNGLDAFGRVLILGRDDPFTQTLAEKLRDDGGYDVHTAHSTLEAGFELHAAPPRMMLVDVSLPGVDPATLTRFLRQTADLHETKIIGIGPDLAQGRGAALLQSGFDSFLAIPFEPRTLIELIDHVLSIPATRGRG